SQHPTVTENPLSHSPNSAVSGTGEGGAASVLGPAANGANGRLICSKTTEICRCGAIEAECQLNWLPRKSSKENGIKNFTEAASQIQYRTAAPFFFSMSVHAAAAQSVDCHT